MPTRKGSIRVGIGGWNFEPWRKTFYPAEIAQSRELVQLYNKWFQQRLPTGETLDLPMSPQLEEIFRVEGVPE